MGGTIRGPGHDYGRAMAVDASGNVYVTGRSGDSGKWQDYATVKYDTNGNELWVARYDSPESDVGYASALAVDLLGNVYVTGDSYTSRGDDYVTIKYDTNGNELWVKRYNGPGDLYDNARAIAVDPSGNIYVTGESDGNEPGFDYDYATVKYVEGAIMQLPAGWSMISLPVRLGGATVTTLFPDVVVMYRYETGTGYVRVEAGGNLEVGMGYWILLDTPQSYVIKGTEITKHTVPVENGWYRSVGAQI